MQLDHLVQRDGALVDHFRLRRFSSMEESLVGEQHSQAVFEVLDMSVKVQAPVELFLSRHFLCWKY